MDNQNCRVGSVTPLTAKSNIITILEYQYQNFMEKASNLEYTDAKLVEFFEQKAQKIQRTLENLVK